MTRTWIVAALVALLAGCGSPPPARNDGTPCAVHGEASKECQVYRYATSGGP